jgi:hypothetical protein
MAFSVVISIRKPHSEDKTLAFEDGIAPAAVELGKEALPTLSR